MSAKTANAKLESELKQEKGNAQDLRKMLAEERSVMSTMDMEHQQHLFELEERHQEKVSLQFDIYVVFWSLSLIRFVLFQVLYLLNQLQNKPISDETKLKEESSREKELLERLRVQVCLQTM